MTEKAATQQVIDTLLKIIGSKEFIISNQNTLILKLQAQLKKENKDDDKDNSQS